MSTEFEEIVIENFGTIEHIKLPLNTPGLILITGLNKDSPKADSNGAGKSLILDAVCWCLWGETVRGLASDEVVRRQIGKDCCVSLTVKEGGNTYVITRHRKDTRVDKPNDLRLFINGVEKGKKMKNLQEIVNRIIGFDFDTFCVMMPGTGINAASLTDSKIKEILEKLLQTEQLTAAYTEAREKLKVVENELKLQTSTHQSILAQLSALDHEIAQLKELEQSFETKKAESVAAKQERIAEYLKDIATCDTEVQKISSLQGSIAHFKKELAVLQQEMVTVEKPAQARLKLWNAELQQHETAIRDIDRDLAALEKKQESLEKLGATCPTCESAITAEHILACKVELSQQKAAVTAPRSAKFAVTQELRKNIKMFTDATAKQVLELQGFVNMKSAAIAELQTALDQANSQAKLKARIERDLAREQAELAKTQNETHNFAQIFSEKAQKADALVQDACQCLNKQKELEKEQKVCNFWVEGFSPAGLRSYMLDYITPILNERASHYSEVLTSGEMKVTFTTKTTLKKGGEKDKFQILVEQKHGGDLYKATSKGEKARADLVIAMALGDLATFRTAKQLPWRFLDEPFENIDDAGNAAVVQLLNDQKSRYKTVFVVTHKLAFKQLFNQRITVVKENGISYLADG